MEKVKLRNNEDVPNYSDPDNFTLEIRHGGIFSSGEYVGGSVCWADNYDVNLFSKWDLAVIARNLGYVVERIQYFFYHKTDGLVEIDSDIRVLECSLTQSTRKVSVVYISDCIVLDETLAFNEESQVTHHVQADNEAGADGDDEADYDIGLVDVNVLADNYLDKDSSNDEDVLDPEDAQWFVDEEYVQSDEDMMQFKSCVVDEIEVDHHVEPGEESDDWAMDSDDLESLDESSSGEEVNELVKYMKPKKKQPKFKQYRRDTDLRDPYFKLGLEFPTMAQCREAIRELSIKSGRPLSFDKNDSDKVIVKCKGQCKGSCPFKIYAAMVGNGPTVRVKTYEPLHQCWRSKKIKHATSTWIADRFDEVFRSNPKIKPRDFIRMVAKQYGIDVTLDQFYKAKEKAKRRIQGGIQEQYAVLRDYGEELKRLNLGSTVKIKTEMTEEGPIFKRIYICYAALKKGFIEGCRKVVGCDGCHIKGLYKGQLLSAVGVDANNGMYPIAFAIVEVENRETWMWFMEYFINDVEILNEGNGWVFISDKQKGLLDVVEEFMPQAEHRHCVRHLYNNFKGAGHTGLALKQGMWAALKSTTVPWFEEEMDKVLGLCKDAHDWLRKRAAIHWSRSHFKTEAKCDILLNNLCKAFNSAILEARDKPILTMLERLRMYLMLRMAKQRELNWTQPVGPRIFGIIEKNRELSNNCYAESSIGGHFEVTHLHGRKFYVNMEDRTCSCRKWDLCGIPCSHAMTCLGWMDASPYDFVHNHCKREAYDRAYGYFISPMSSQDLWPKTGGMPILPPLYHKQLGRPKKRRILEPNEIPKGAKKLQRYHAPSKCTLCKNEGHNKRTCPQRGQALEPPPHVPVSENMYNASGTTRGTARGTGTDRGRGIGNSIMTEEGQFGQGTRGRGRHGVQYVRVGGTRRGRGQFVAPTRERGQFESFIGRSKSTSFGTRGGGQTIASAGRGRSQFIAPTRGKGQPTSFGNGGGQALLGIGRGRGQYVNRATRITQVARHSTISTEATASQPISKATSSESSTRHITPANSNTHWKL